MKDASTSARVLLFATIGPAVGATTAPLGVAGGCTIAGAFFALSSSAHDLGADGFGGDALGVSSALPFSSGTGAVSLAESGWAACGDFADFCVADAALGAFPDLIGISGTAGFVVLRVCLVVAADG